MMPSTSQEEIPPPPPPPPSSQTPTQQTPHTNGLEIYHYRYTGQIRFWPPRTARRDCRKKQRKARTTLLKPYQKNQLAKLFPKMTDAKEMWDAIKSRFGGNDESKKMQKYILKQQFEGFSVSNTEGLHKGYDSSIASSTSSPQNVAFVSENTNSTNEVSTAYCVPNLSGQNTKFEQTSSYSLLANQSSCPQLDHEDLEHIMMKRP
ncbi:hypothetical protein Tco_0157765 [Tanacetum coccineum]